ncbi:MAG: hypothetical protein KGL53_12395, partial [Elusimicrobia bacterium]|nr:hypothetical protein [Elusimicrobiota bacterium]
PSSIVFDDVSSTTLVASAYAPSPAFHNLGQGQSGTDIAVGGVFQGWHGSTWTEKAAMPSADEDAGIAVVDGKLFVVGGVSGSSRLSSAELYDPAADAWTSEAAMPTARGNLRAVALAGKVYALGGANGGPSIAVNEMYDPVSNVWTTKQSMPSARAFFAASALDGRILAAGGWTGSVFIANVEAYDPASDSWTVRSPLPFPHSGTQAVVAQGRLYVIGGSSQTSTATGATQSYDPAADSWTSKAEMPTARYNFAAAAVGGKIYAAGGANPNESYMTTVEEYDPQADAWAGRLPLPSMRAYPFGAELGGRFYTVGGGNASSALAVNEAFDPGTSQAFSGLKPNTQYAFTAKARNADGVETAAVAASTYTLAVAALPAAGAPAIPAVFVTSVTLAWSSGTAAGGYDGPGATYVVEASTVATFSPVLSSAAFSAAGGALGGLQPFTTHYFRLLALNAAGAPAPDWLLLGSTTTL